MDITRLIKGTFLQKEGKMSEYTFFVLKGCIRQYSPKGGGEKTMDFFTEGQWITSSNIPDLEVLPYNLICMEDSAVIRGNEKKASALFKMFPHFESLATAVMEKTYAAQRNLMISNHTDSAGERYLKLLNSRPDIFQRVPQYHIASYLGIQPESLSRIRERLTSQFG